MKTQAHSKKKPTNISDFVAYYRAKTELTQREMAAVMGVNASYIAQLETNRTMRPVAFARALYKRMKSEEDKQLLASIWMSMAFQEIAGPGGEAHPEYEEVDLKKPKPRA